MNIFTPGQACDSQELAAVKLAQSIRTLLWVREVASSSPVSTKWMLLWKLSVLEIPLDKELTANCLVETCMKLEELTRLWWLNVV